MNNPDWDNYAEARTWNINALRVLIRQLGTATEIPQLEALTNQARGMLAGFHLAGLIPEREVGGFEAEINEANWQAWSKLASGEAQG